MRVNPARTSLHVISTSTMPIANWLRPNVGITCVWASPSSSAPCGLNRPGFPGGRFVRGLRGDTGHRKLGIVGGLGLGGRNVPDRLEKATFVEPVDPFESNELDRFKGAPGAAPMDHLGFVKAVPLTIDTQLDIEVSSS